MSLEDKLKALRDEENGKRKKAEESEERLKQEQSERNKRFEEKKDLLLKITAERFEPLLNTVSRVYYEGKADICTSSEMNEWEPEVVTSLNPPEFVKAAWVKIKLTTAVGGRLMVIVDGPGPRRTFAYDDHEQGRVFLDDPNSMQIIEQTILSIFKYGSENPHIFSWIP